jgi:predicted Zn-ribbon and HTH transcriptional regulator
VTTLNAPGTRGPSCATIARGHRVKDASQFISYASANATAVMQNPKNAKPVDARGVSQIKNENCLAGSVVASQNGVASAAFVEQLPELQDRITRSTLLATTDPNYRKEDIIMAARQAIGPNCCATCGKVNWREGKVNFASTCSACKGVNAGDTNPDGTRKFKSAYVYPTAIS